jgi:hypothetical protein
MPTGDIWVNIDRIVTLTEGAFFTGRIGDRNIS